MLFVKMLRLCNNGPETHLHSLYSITKFHLQFFSTAITQPNLLADFLVDSIGFSREQAISASTKVTCLKPGNNKPELVLNFFKQIGLDKSGIKMLVSPAPRLLFADIDKTLKPKIKLLQELGLSGHDLVNVLSKSGAFLRTGLKTSIIPNLDYLRKLLRTDDLLVKAIKRSPVLLSYSNLHKVMAPNVALLQNLGFSSKDIEKFILRNPRMFVQKVEWLEDIVQRVEKDFCIHRDSWMFFYGVEMLSSNSKSNVEMKLGIFRSFGWSDSDIIAMVQRLPLCLNASEAKLRNALMFFMEELGCKSSYVASHPTLLMFSLEKRIFPRSKILEILKEKQLIKKVPSIYTVMKCSESKFLENYVLPFKDEMPEAEAMRFSFPKSLSCQGSRLSRISPLYKKTFSTSNTRMKIGIRTQSKNVFQPFQHFYSTDAAAAAAIPHNNFLVDFLVNSVGFSTEKAMAISTSAKVTRLNPRNNKPLLVIKFFRQIGLDKTQIKNLVSYSPGLLFANVDKTLKPKIKVLQEELGLSGSDLAKVLSQSGGTFLLLSLDNFIRPNLDYFRKVLGSDERVTKIIKGTPQILWYNAPKLLSPNIAFLRNLSGFPNEHIEKLILLNPLLLLRKSTEWLENAVYRVENDLHVPRHSPMFIYGIIAIVSLGESRLEMKLETFRRFGWSDLEILTLVQKHPLCLSLSEAKLGNALNFFMKELGYGASYVASRPMLLTASLEKRVLPRHKILKLLDQKNLSKCSLYTALVLTESKFLKKYVLPFTDEMPELYELYMKSTRVILKQEGMKLHKKSLYRKAKASG